LALLSKDQLQENSINLLWKSYWVDRQVDGALRDILTSDDAGLVRLVRKRAKSLKPSEIRQSLRRANVYIDFPLLVTDGAEIDDEHEPDDDHDADEESEDRPKRRIAFRWELTMDDHGEYVLRCRYLEDESENFEVTGRRIPPEGAFEPARAELLEEIYRHIAPLFPEIPDNLVRSKAWSGVHKVYPVKDYAKK
jgi:hypothetical protein